MKQDIVSPLLRTYKPVNFSLVYTNAEGCCLVVSELSRKSTRNKPLKSDFPACKLTDSFENSSAMSLLFDTQQVKTLEFEAFFLHACYQPNIPSDSDKIEYNIIDGEII